MPDFEEKRKQMDTRILQIEESGTLAAFNGLINWLTNQFDNETEDFEKKQTLKCKICQVSHARDRYSIFKLIEIIGSVYDWNNEETSQTMTEYLQSKEK